MSVIDLGGGVSWVHESFPETHGHIHVSVYLVDAPEGAILMDSGSFHHRQRLADRISDATAGRGVGAIILSHSDYPHSGNIPAFRRDWGDFEIVASCGDPELQGLPYARRTRIGGRRRRPRPPLPRPRPPARLTATTRPGYSTRPPAPCSWPTASARSTPPEPPTSTGDGSRRKDVRKACMNSMRRRCRGCATPTRPA